MTHTVLPMLVERVGGKKTLKIRILRTCAVGESNVDRAIRHLMTAANPSVGLSAHPGQTDIRITAKADTKAEADALIAPVEDALRRELGVAIYGVDDESVAEVVGRLLVNKGLELGVLDTVTDGQLVGDLQKAGFGKAVETDLHAPTIPEISSLEGFDTKGLEIPSASVSTDGAELALALAGRVAPQKGVGLAIIDPISEGTVVVGVRGPGEQKIARSMKGSRREAEYRRRWMIIQGLDWIRRALLAELESPIDWR